jgi:hypothetical protein
MVFLDDGHIFARRGISAEDSVSMQAIQSYITSLGRKFGWSAWLSSQMPENLNEEVMRGFKAGWKILGAIDVESLTTGFLPAKIREVVENLIYRPEKGLIQNVLVHYDSKQYKTFYQLNPLLAHPCNILKTK